MRLAIALLLAPLAAQAQQVVPVPYADLQARLAARQTFEGYPRLLSPGAPLDGIQRYKSLDAGEHFHGQQVTDNAGFDALTGLPTSPLTIEPGPPGRNLSVAFYMFFSNQLSGEGPAGFPADASNGEGAIALQFDHDQQALGFLVAAEPEPGTQGSITVAFYARDARLIARLRVPLDPGRHGYGFERPGREADIAGITIENDDPAGIAIDDVLYDVTVPSS